MRTVDGLKCKLCGEIFHNRKEIKKHLKKSHGVRPQKKLNDVLQNYYTKIIGEI